MLRVKEEAHPDEGNMEVNKKIRTVLEAERWDPGSSHQLLKVDNSLLQSGRMTPKLPVQKPRTTKNFVTANY